jgi:dihydropteroate synthase/2-amino-4-hydroxy-6-hydroxymethyldihydropteridine diphosphokinase
MTPVIYLGLGTNLGDRDANLQAAREALPPQVKVLRASTVHETAPWGYADQPAFLNQVLECETELQPLELLAHLKAIEARLGRTPTFRFGPRLIDLDILFYGEAVVDTPILTIPHPRLHQRAFALAPLAELAPHLKHPRLGKTVQELLDGLSAKETPLPWGTRTFIMGILNVTPDSFSGDGLLAKDDALKTAVELGQRFVAVGADILDIGGESTRPGAQNVSAEEEMARVVPVIRALAGEGLKAILSVDTYKSEVAEAALQAGAQWVNDIWGLRADPHLAQVAAQHNAPVILMHNRLKPASVELQNRLGGRYVGLQYQNLMEDIKKELLESVAIARGADIPEEHIILDPGIGFGKTVEQNLELLNRLDEFRSLGYPLLLGPSRKSFIGYTLNLPPEQRLEGTAAAVAIGIARGADIVRVHDVEAMVRVVRMADAICRR